MEEEPEAAAVFARAAEGDEPDGDEEESDSGIGEHLGEVWRAFWRLSAERPSRLSTVFVKDAPPMLIAQPGPVPFTAIAAWSARYGHDEDEAEIFQTLIDAMDDEFLKIWREKQKVAHG